MDVIVARSVRAYTRGMSSIGNHMKAIPTLATGFISRIAIGRFCKLLQLAVLSMFMTGPAPAAVPPPADSELSRQADALLNDYAEAGLFTGTVLVARGGRPIFRKGYRAANREWMMPNTVGTRYRIGSIGKQFTAAAILQMVDQGKLRLDDPIEGHVPGLPASWGKATIRQLLSHTSGIPSYTMIEGFHARLMPLEHTPKELTDLVRNMPLNYEHGTKFGYNNSGYVLLGRIIESVSGMGYADYLEKKLLAPLGLRNSGYDDGRILVAQLAQDYTDRKDQVVKSRLVNMSNTYAAGGMVSTVDDLLAWQQMLVGGKVLSPHSLQAMFTDGGHRYGFGWYVRENLSRKLYEHGGNIGAYSSLLAYYPDDQVVVIVLSNYGEDVVTRITDELARLALGVAPAYHQVRVDPRLYAGLEGRYLLDSTEFTISARGKRLFAGLAGQKELEIFPESEYRYFYKAVDALLTFERNPAGKVDAVTLHQNGSTFRAMRLDGHAHSNPSTHQPNGSERK